MLIRIKTNATNYEGYVAELSKIFLDGIKKYDRILALGVIANDEDDSSELRRSLYFVQNIGPALVITEGSSNQLSKPWKLRFSTFEIDGGKLQLANRITYEFVIKNGKIEASVLNEESYELNASENIVIVNSVDQHRRPTKTPLPQSEFIAKYKKFHELAHKTAKAYNLKHNFFGPFAELYTKLATSIGVKSHSNGAFLHGQWEIVKPANSTLVIQEPGLSSAPELSVKPLVVEPSNGSQTKTGNIQKRKPIVRRKEKPAILPKSRVLPSPVTINPTVTETALNLFETIDGMQAIRLKGSRRMQKVYFEDAKLKRVEVYILIGEKAELVKSSIYKYVSNGKEVKIIDQLKDGNEIKTLKPQLMPCEQFMAMVQNTIGDVIAKAEQAVNPKDKAIGKDIARTYAADLQIRRMG